MVVISHAKLQRNIWKFVSALKWQRGIKHGTPPFPRCLVNRQFLGKKTLIEKKSRLTVCQNHLWNTIRTKHFWRTRLVMTFLTKVRVAMILSSFRLVLKKKSGKEIPISLNCSSIRSLTCRVFGKDCSKQFCFIRCRR